MPGLLQWLVKKVKNISCLCTYTGITLTDVAFIMGSWVERGTCYFQFVICCVIVYLKYVCGFRVCMNENWKYCTSMYSYMYYLNI
jgi:hypothetical protein